MVAIPTYLLASAAASSLNSINNIIRSAEPEARPAPGTFDTTSDFASILGPVVTDNFPDPSIFYLDGISYAFATNNKAVSGTMIHVQVASSTDNQTWTIMDGYDALPQIGAWETGAGVWAPDVVQVDDGSYVMYYTDSVTWAPNKHCVGVATSSSVLGPYAPQPDAWACPDVNTLGGAIDPDGFRDPSTGLRYVAYKVDGNSIGHGGSCGNSVEPIVPTPIMLQQVAANGVDLVGNAVQILDRDNLDGPLIEAPSLHRSDEGIYFVFFSSNCFTTPFYDTSYATATSIFGPYTKSQRPLFITGDGPDLLGPGGMDIVHDGDLIVFHGQLDGTNNSGDLSRIATAPAKRGEHRLHKKKSGTLVRGMYSAVATFSGTTVTLSGPIPGSR